MCSTSAQLPTHFVSKWTVKHMKFPDTIPFLNQIYCHGLYSGKAVIIAIITFNSYLQIRWVIPLIKRGYKHELNMGDMFTFTADDNATLLADRLERFGISLVFTPKFVLVKFLSLLECTTMKN